MSPHCNLNLDVGLDQETRLSEQESRFLHDFCRLMASAHYRLLGGEVWDAAQSEEFLVGNVFCGFFLGLAWCMGTVSGADLLAGRDLPGWQTRFLLNACPLVTP